MDASTLQLTIPIAGIIAVLFAIYLARDVLGRDKGPQAMQDVADTIREGADAFIKRQYTTIAGVGVVIFIVSWQFIPFHSLIYQGAVRQIPQALYEAAALDAALAESPITNTD